MKQFTRREMFIGGAVVVVLAGLVLGLIAEWRAANPPAIVPTDPLDWVGPQSRLRPDAIAANEAAVLEDIRKVIAGQAAYRAANQGFYDSRLQCLEFPQQCIPFYPRNAPAFLDRRLASRDAGSGYIRSFSAGPYPSVIPRAASGSSVTSYRYDAWPQMVGHHGVRAFAADATGRICFTSGGTPVSQGSEGELDPSCTTLELFEPEVASDAPPAPQLPDLRLGFASVPCL